MAILASINIIIIFLAYSGAGSNWHQALRVPMPGSSIITQPTQVVGTPRECKQTASAQIKSLLLDLSYRHYDKGGKENDKLNDFGGPEYCGFSVQYIVKS